MSHQQDFLFVDAAQAKTSRQGRRNARSFVMQNARRKNPWSTSKHAAKHRKTGSPESTSPNSVGTSPSTHTPNTATPSPPLVSNRPDYFPPQGRGAYALARNDVCPDCHVFLCRPGERLCPRCVLQNPAPAEDPNNESFDPFRTSSVEVTRDISDLLRHCKS
jgi:hypothetical protein